MVYGSKCMKIVSILLSMLVFITLSVNFINTDNKNTVGKVETNNQGFNQPVRLDDALLEVEKKWEELKAKRNVKTNKTAKVETPVNTKNILAIGDEEYVLYGIFSESTAPFILLKGKDKSKENAFMKLTLGETLGENFILAEIYHNMIVFTQGDERIEFKLFERKNHADNKKQ